MTLATVHGVLVDVADNPVEDGAISIVLWPLGQVAYAPNGSRVVPPDVIYTAADGSWHVDLEPTTTMTPGPNLDGSPTITYRLRFRSYGHNLVEYVYIYVPTQGGPIENLLVQPPTAPPQAIVSGPPGPSANTLTIPAGMDISAHRAVVQQADGTLIYADPTDATQIGLPIWMSLTAAAMGQNVDVITYGEAAEITWAWTARRVIFVAPTGVLTQTYQGSPDSWSRVVGTALSATVLFWNPFVPIALAS